ncbi:UNVERIFIED_CONTAM: hypothetical protein RMT77_012979 [Armadillidium vulgare]
MYKNNLELLFKILLLTLCFLFLPFISKGEWDLEYREGYLVSKVDYSLLTAMPCVCKTRCFINESCNGLSILKEMKKNYINSGNHFACFFSLTNEVSQNDNSNLWSFIRSKGPLKSTGPPRHQKNESL